MDTNPEDKFAWADWLKAERERQGLTQADLARKSGENRQLINDYEKHKRVNPQTEQLANLSIALGYDDEYLPRMAGKLPPKLEGDETLDRIDYLYTHFKDPDSRRQGLEYFEYLKLKEDKGNYDEGKSPATKSR